MNFESQKILFCILPILLVIIGYLLLSQRRAKVRASLFCSTALLENLLTNHNSFRKWMKWCFSLLAVGLLLFSLAKPRWGYEYVESRGKGIDFVIALDTSKSMLAQDIKPNRLERSKLAILDLVEKLQGDRIGLVAFAGSAFLQCPLTLDYDAFTQSLNALDTSIINRGGTDIALAIAEAKAAFSKESKNRIIILITDGEDLEASGIKEAKAASEEGIRIFTVGVGSEEGELIPINNENGVSEFLRDSSGEYVRTKLDEDTLRLISSSTDSFYISLFNNGGLDLIYEEGLSIVPKEERKIKMEEIPIERYQIFTAFAFLLLFFEPLIKTTRNRK